MLRRSARCSRFAGPNAQDCVRRAPAEETRGKRNDTDPAPGRLIARAEKSDSRGDEREPDDDAQNPIDDADICGH